MLVGLALVIHCWQSNLNLSVLYRSLFTACSGPYGCPGPRNLVLNGFMATAYTVHLLASFGSENLRLVCR